MLWSFYNKTAPNVYKSKENAVMHTPDLVGTVAQTLSRVDVYKKTGVTSIFTDKPFTAGDTSGPKLQTDGPSTFVEGQIVIVEGAKHNNGIYEVDSVVSDVITFRGDGGTDTVETFTRNQVTTGTTSGTISQVEVSVRRTSITGGIEHGLGNKTPIVFKDLAHAEDVKIVEREEFKATDARFFGELGIPGAQPGWADAAVTLSTIDLVTETVLGVEKQVIRHNDNHNSAPPASSFVLSAAQWANINAHGASYGGRARLDTTAGANGFFSGLQANAAENPLGTGNRRYGVAFADNGGNLKITEFGTATSSTMDGVGVNPLVLFNEWFDWDILVPAGVGAAQCFIQGVLTDFSPTFRVNSGGLGTIATVGSGSSSGLLRVVYHDNFGVTIYEDDAEKTLDPLTMSGDVAQVLIPPGKRDYTVTLPDDATRSIGATLVVVAQNVGGKVKITTQDRAAPQVLFNGLREFERDITEVTTLSFSNIVDKNSVYIGELIPELVIREKLLTFTTGGSEGDTVDVTHFLDSVKIVSVDVLIQADATTCVPPRYNAAGALKYTFFVTPTKVSIRTDATSSLGLINSAGTILIRYTV